jgi:pyrroline-5-carboxylate reductase
MKKTIGFVGGGRVARIIMGGIKKAGRMPASIIASDTKPDILKKLQSEFPGVQTVLNNNREAAAQELVFLGLHPPALLDSLADISCLKPDAILISLAPKLSVNYRKGSRIQPRVRIIPNASSIMGQVTTNRLLGSLEPTRERRIAGFSECIGQMP